MFNNLKKEMALTNLSVRKISLLLGYKSAAVLYYKLSGHTEFSLTDMLKMQAFLNEKNRKKLTLDYYFKEK